MIILETERLLLRYLRHEDIPCLINLWTDPDVTRYMGGPRDVETLRTNLVGVAGNPLAEQFDLWPLVERSSGLLIGHSGLLEKEVDGLTEYEMVYVLARSTWGKGYATEIGRALVTYAYHVRNINRLIALVEPENTASEKVAIKVGMHLEKEVVRPGGGIRRVYAVFLPH
jgi:[ribosomal protein S5]-alanine N-acetyltransferase